MGGSGDYVLSTLFFLRPHGSGGVCFLFLRGDSAPRCGEDSALRCGLLFVPAKSRQKLARGIPPGTPVYGDAHLQCSALSPALARRCGLHIPRSGLKAASRSFHRISSSESNPLRWVLIRVYGSWFTVLNGQCLHGREDWVCQRMPSGKRSGCEANCFIDRVTCLKLCRNEAQGTPPAAASGGHRTDCSPKPKGSLGAAPLN